MLLPIGLIRAGASPSVVYKKTCFYELLYLNHQTIDWWNSYHKPKFSSLNSRLFDGSFLDGRSYKTIIVTGFYYKYLYLSNLLEII